MTNKSECCKKKVRIGHEGESDKFLGKNICTFCGKPCTIASKPITIHDVVTTYKAVGDSLLQPSPFKTVPTVASDGTSSEYCPAHGYPLPCAKCGYSVPAPDRLLTDEEITKACHYEYENEKHDANLTECYTHQAVLRIVKSQDAKTASLKDAEIAELKKQIVEGK